MSSYKIENFTGIFEDVISKELCSDIIKYFHNMKEIGLCNNSGSHFIYDIKIQETDIGQGYHIWHYESSDKNLSNRLLAFILYLNDVDEGGETEFLYYPKRVKPKTGTVVLWPAAFTHAHRGNPPISNCKYILTGGVEF